MIREFCIRQRRSTYGADEAVQHQLQTDRLTATAERKRYPTLQEEVQVFNFDVRM